MAEIAIESTAKHFSEISFWTKVRAFAKAAGREVIHKGLCLYYAYRDSATPTWAKAVIAGALGYFISPLDAIPDVIPGIGYADDLGVLAAALATVTTFVTKEHIAKANEQIKTWFNA